MKSKPQCKHYYDREAHRGSVIAGSHFITLFFLSVFLTNSLKIELGDADRVLSKRVMMSSTVLRLTCYAFNSHDFFHDFAVDGLAQSVSALLPVYLFSYYVSVQPSQ